MAVRVTLDMLEYDAREPAGVRFTLDMLEYDGQLAPASIRVTLDMLEYDAKERRRNNARSFFIG